MASSLNAPKGRLPEKVAAPQVSETVPTGHDHDTDHELEDLKRDVEDQRIGKIFEEGLHDANVYRRYLRTPDGKAVTGETPTVSKVDFQGNGHDEESIGLAELMDESVAEVRIEGTHRGRSYTMIGARDGLRGSFFAGGADNKGSYLPVFSGFKVEVVRRRSPEELKALKEGLAAKIAEYAKLPYLQEYAVPKEEFEAIIRVGLEQNIDPSILFSLRAVAKTEGRAFGLYDMGSASFAGQLVLVCHRLAQAAKTWEKSLGKELYDPDRRGVRYSAEFLAFAARSYGILPGHDDVLPDKDFVLKTMECYDRASGGGLYSPQEMDQAIESQVTTAVRNIGRSGDRTSTNDVITRL